MKRIWPFRNIGLKLLSVGLAITLWLIVPVEHNLGSVLVHLRNLGPDLSAQATPTAAQVVVLGRRPALVRMRADPVMLFVDLAGLGAGDYVLSVSADPSSEGDVVRIDPAAVQVQIIHAQR